MRQNLRARIVIFWQTDLPACSSVPAGRSLAGRLAQHSPFFPMPIGALLVILTVLLPLSFYIQ
jgi:hypothetical protein